MLFDHESSSDADSTVALRERSVDSVGADDGLLTGVADEEVAFSLLGVVTPDGTGEVFTASARASRWDLTTRSSTPRARLHARDHTPTLTEPISDGMR